jgi:hypothetical protein
MSIECVAYGLGFANCSCAEQGLCVRVVFVHYVAVVACPWLCLSVYVFAEAAVVHQCMCCRIPAVSVVVMIAVCVACFAAVLA